MSNILAMRKRGLLKGSHKIRTPRLLKIFLQSVIPSKRLYGEYKNQKEAIRLDEYTCRMIYGNGEKERYKGLKEINLSGFFIILEGYLNSLGLDLLLLFLDEAKEKNKRVLKYSVYDLLNRLGKKDSGKEYNDIFEQIKRIAKIGIVVGKDEITERQLKRKIDTEMDLIYLIKAKQRLDKDKKGGTIKYQITIEIGEQLFNSIRHFHTLIDWKIYNKFKNPIDKMFYVYLRLLDYGKKFSFVNIETVFKVLNMVKDRNYKQKLEKTVANIKKYTLQSIDIEIDYEKQVLKIDFGGKESNKAVKKLSTRRTKYRTIE